MKDGKNCRWAVIFYVHYLCILIILLIIAAKYKQKNQMRLLTCS